MAELIRGLMQRIPRGLLSFLDVKTGGTYPTVLGGLLQPTIDLTEWYGAEAQHYTAVGAAVGTTVAGNKLPFTATSVTDLTNGANLVVPDREIWRLNEATVDLGNGANAADIFHCALCIRFNTTANRFFIPPQTLHGDPGAGVAFNRAYYALDRPLLVAPGNEIALETIRVSAAAGTPFTPTARLVLARFTI